MKTFMRLFLCLLLAAAFIFLSFAGLAIADGPIIGEIRMFAGPSYIPYVGDDPPDGWLNCNGNCYPIGTYPELFNVISYTYGSSGAGSSFCLPNLSDRFPLGGYSYICTTGPGCTLGGTGGEISHTLTITETAVHTHSIRRSYTKYIDSGTVLGFPGTYGEDTVGNNSTERNGGGAPHNNMPPYLVINYIIAYTTTQITPTPTTTATATPTPTATSTPTTTPTPGATPAAYTYTLSTGTVLYQPVSMNFGQIVIATIGTALVAANFLLFLFVRRRA